MTLAAVLCCAMTTTVFTACSSDDDDTKSGGSNKKYVVAMYFDFTLEQDLMNFFDVYCTFTNVKGEVQTVQCTSLKNYYNQTVDYDKAPDNYEFSIYAVPKKEIPTIDAEATYHFKCEYSINYGVRATDKPDEVLNTIIFQLPRTDGLDVGGKKVLDYLEKHKEKLDVVKKHTGSKSK